MIVGISIFSCFFTGIGLGVNGVVMFVTPFLTNLWGLVVATTIGGLMFGYLDAGFFQVTIVANLLEIVMPTGK